MSALDRIIFHIDMDAFFASIEQRDNPAYRGKPVIVGAEPGKRGVVSAASYEARKYGIHSAMPINEAYGRCPKGVFVRPRMEAYSDASGEIMRILESFSPRVEQVSVDEAFVDMTGTAKLFGEPLEAAGRIRSRIRERQHLTASVGIAPNKFLAKIASDLNKPDGVTCAPFDAEGIVRWLAPMKVGRLWGVGVKSQAVFNRMGIETVGDLQQLEIETLADRFGKSGAALYWLARGIDDRPVGEGERAKSISREHTFNVDSRDPEEWKRTLLSLAQDVARRARRDGVKGTTVFLTFRRPDFSRHTRRKPLPQPSNVAKVIYDEVLVLLDQSREAAFRLIGVGITGLDDAQQMNLFDDDRVVKAWEASEQAMDRIVEKFGPDTIAKGGEFGAETGVGSRSRQNGSGRR